MAENKPRPSRAKPSNRPGRVVEIPVLKGCPKCGLPIQQGENPDKLAFHDCQFVTDAVHSHPASFEGIRQAALNRLRDALPAASPKDVIQMLGLLEELDGVGERKRKGKELEEETPDDVRSFVSAGAKKPT